MKTRTEITVERDRWVVVQRQRKSDWCPNCSRQAERLNIDDALEGLLLICPHSNAVHKKAQEPQK